MRFSLPDFLDNQHERTLWYYHPMTPWTDDTRLASIMVTNTCWLWMGSTDNKGYAFVGKHPNASKNIYGHRWAYEYFVSPIPEGMNVLHRCDVRNCLNPDHLFLGTHSDNMADMKAKGRARSGGPKRRRFTPEQVRAIRSDSRSHAAVARDHGSVGQDSTYAVIVQIRTGRSYIEVE
jgi:hypothetical protein